MSLNYFEAAFEEQEPSALGIQLSGSEKNTQINYHGGHLSVTKLLQLTRS